MPTEGMGPMRIGTVLRRTAQSAVRQRCRRLLCWPHLSQAKEWVMGKYLIAWILGVPAFVLVIAYFFFH